MIKEDIISKISKEKIENAKKKALTMVDRYMDKFGTSYPSNSVDVLNNYTVCNNNSWISGFWPGLLWLSYKLTGDNKYKDLALKMIDSFMERIDNELYLDHHDLGFLYSPSCVMAYNLTGDQRAKEAAIKAADYLIKRYIPNGKYIKAWGPVEGDVEDGYFYIIDCLVNLPILYWASDVTGDTKYRDIATNHLITTAETIIRPDGSTYHNYRFDMKTGERIGGGTVQGFSADSCWSRGQSWGVLGFALGYSATKDERCLECFKKVADFFTDHLPTDKVAYWDLCFTQGDEARDSSASAIYICGILEMAKNIDNTLPDMKRYTETASQMLESLIDNYTYVDDGDDGLIRRVTGSKPHGMAVDSIGIYADYYYLEIFVRLLTDGDLWL